MAIPIFFHVVFATQAFPLAAILAVRGRRPPDPYRRIALWSCMLMIFDVLSRIVAILMGTNLFLVYFTEPIEVGMTLWILAAWQPTAALRSAYLAVIPAIALVIAVVLALSDLPRMFDAWIGPGLALVALVAVLQTLVHRTLLSRELLTEQDWFWICLGLSLFWVSNVPLPPIMNAYVIAHVDWLVRLLYVRAGLLMLAFSLVAWGVLCTRNQLQFSGRL